jgi:signal transduction protein with GAF and PtsI domain
MATSIKDPRTELKRLRHALEAVSTDLDAIERRPHLSLRLAAECLEADEPQRLETVVHHFAFAIKQTYLTQP